VLLAALISGSLQVIRKNKGYNLQEKQKDLNKQIAPERISPGNP
jgi:hypothetical protein